MTYEGVRQVFDYQDGVLYWKVRSSDKIKIGQVAGSPDKTGRVRIRYKGKMYLRSRLIWLYLNGEWPSDMLDHRDGDPSNDSPDNLREATNRQNLQNVRPKGHSPYKGVSVNRGRGTKGWRARIRPNGRELGLGYFHTPEEAARAYDSAAIEYYGEYARLNFPNETLNQR